MTVPVRAQAELPSAFPPASRPVREPRRVSCPFAGVLQSKRRVETASDVAIDLGTLPTLFVNITASARP